LFFKKILLSCVLLFAVVPMAYAAVLYVVVSDNLRGMSFSQTEIKRIFLGEITSIKTGRVHLIYPSYSSDEIITLSKFVGKDGSVRNLKSYWSKMIFTGRGNPPDTADSEAELKRLLSEDNAIGVSKQPTGMNVVYTISE
jgi:hypothetical protein